MHLNITLPVYKRDPNLWIRAFEGPQQVVLEMPNKHTTNDTIKNNTTKADGNDQRNGMTHARNKYKTNLIFHVNRNSSLLEPAVLINFNGGEKMKSNSCVVQIGISNYDKTKLDAPNLTCVVV